MTIIDDQSLLAMQAARMSRPSIAQTMGWRLARVEKRLDELAEAATRAAVAVSGLGAAAGVMESRFAAPPVIPPVTERPILSGEALILRSFIAGDGGHASHGKLFDGRCVLIWTGAPRLQPGARTKVEAMPTAAPRAAEFCWRAVEGGGDA